MPRRNRGSHAGAGRRSSRVRANTVKRSPSAMARTPTPRRSPTPAIVGRRRRTTRRAPGDRRSETVRSRVYGISPLLTSRGPLDRSRKMAVQRGQTPGKYGLPERILSARRLDERSRDNPRKRCARTKKDRRAAIIASGHGGRNGFTNYRRHEKC